MGSKNYTDVLIDGKVYTLGGIEEESYLQQVASYINDKLAELRRQAGFSKQTDDYQSVMALLNLADDYFKERDHLKTVSNQKAELEKEVYSLKHELVGAQMRLESAQGQARERSQAAADRKIPAAVPEEKPDEGAAARELLQLRAQMASMKEELEKYRALDAAEAARKNRRDHR